MKWHEEDAVGDEVPVWGDLEMSEQMQSLGWSSRIYWVRLGAALQARTAGALWSTNCKGQPRASSTQQSQPSHILGSHANMQLTPDKYPHGDDEKDQACSVHHAQHFQWGDSKFSGQCYPQGSLWGRDLMHIW